MASTMDEYNRLLPLVKDILFREWDPIGVNEFGESAIDEYDSYAPAVCGLLMNGADERKLADHLSLVVCINMGPPLVNGVIDKPRYISDGDRRAARALVALLGNEGGGTRG